MRTICLTIVLIGKNNEVLETREVLFKGEESINDMNKNAAA